MKKILSSLKKVFDKRFTVPLEGRFSLALTKFSTLEKRIFFGALGVLAFTAVVMLAGVNNAFIVKVPTFGGTLVEGVLNTPAHINPLLDTSEIGSEADRDLTALVYSGLLRAKSDGSLIPDLAEEYLVSPDGLTYTFTLKKNLTWHDGEKITADDVIFTIKTAGDSRTKSPKRANWDGVELERVDDLTIKFLLKKPYAPFLENTTIGILPKHIWEAIDFNRFDTNNYNKKPIGSGPYQIDSIETVTTKNGDQLPVSYTLKAFSRFALGKPYLSTIKMVFYRNEDDLVAAVARGDVHAINSISPKSAEGLSGKGYRVLHTPLPRVLAVFFNQNQAPIFVDSAVRKALTLAVPKTKLINNVLAGYGTMLDSPIPPGNLGYKIATTETPLADRMTAARALLTKASWTFDDTSKTWTKKKGKETTVLQFSLATSEAPELKAVAEELKTAWEELGVPVEVKIFATGDLKETVVRPRKFDTLFFGQVLGRTSDPYPFWHSSQRLDPGLNIASYVNSSADKALEQARAESNPEKRAQFYETFKNEITKDVPAIFLYAPEFLYVVPKDVHGISLNGVTIPAERFSNIYEWYISTDNVWKIFAS
ncbi:MAG: Extracellular solute-binding protein [Parcubacteria group bacterium GW2011_GWA2_49_16]|nr:MAG: Extracellular solute-binding protein [Parcubacteria group bacterium GW2011_GWA2_49_16]